MNDQQRYMKQYQEEKQLIKDVREIGTKYGFEKYAILKKLSQLSPFYRKYIEQQAQL